MAWNNICKTSDIENGKAKEFDLNGKKILISNFDNKYYAIDSICSHMGGDLGKGKINNNVVICPKHHAQFDLKTGKVTKNINGFFKAMTRKEASDLKSYNTKVENENIMIEL